MARKARTETQTADKFRTTPLTDTITHVRGLHKSAIIYKCAASSYWQFRVFHDGAQRKRSTKLEDKAEALKQAKLIYGQMLLDNGSGIGSAAKTKSKANALESVAESLFAKQEVMIAQDELAKGKNRNERYTFQRHILPFFKDHDIKRIDADALDAFKMHLAKQGYAKTTQSNYLALMSKLLKEAAKKHHIQFLPIMPRVRTEDTPRGYFDSNQYTKLWQTAKSNEGKIYEFRTKAGVVYRRTTITRECYELIMFMRNTFTRPSDIPVIKHRHVYHVQRGDLRLIELRHPTTKMHNGNMASTPHAVIHYHRICEARVKVGRGKPDDYVFMPEMANRASALKELARQFTAVLRLAGLKTDEDGKDRTMYSLRHTAITAALLAGSSHDERIKLKK